MTDKTNCVTLLCSHTGIFVYLFHLWSLFWLRLRSFSSIHIYVYHSYSYFSSVEASPNCYIIFQEKKRASSLDYLCQLPVPNVTINYPILKPLIWAKMTRITRTMTNSEKFVLCIFFFHFDVSICHIISPWISRLTFFTFFSSLSAQWE